MLQNSRVPFFSSCFWMGFYLERLWWPHKEKPEDFFIAIFSTPAPIEVMPLLFTLHPSNVLDISFFILLYELLCTRLFSDPTRVASCSIELKPPTATALFQAPCSQSNSTSINIYSTHSINNNSSLVLLFLLHPILHFPDRHQTIFCSHSSRFFCTPEQLFP